MSLPYSLVSNDIDFSYLSQSIGVENIDGIKFCSIAQIRELASKIENLEEFISSQCSFYASKGIRTIKFDPNLNKNSFICIPYPDTLKIISLYDNTFGKFKKVKDGDNITLTSKKGEVFKYTVNDDPYVVVLKALKGIHHVIVEEKEVCKPELLPYSDIKFLGTDEQSLVNFNFNYRSRYLEAVERVILAIQKPVYCENDYTGIVQEAAARAGILSSCSHPLGSKYWNLKKNDLTPDFVEIRFDAILRPNKTVWFERVPSMLTYDFGWNVWTNFVIAEDILPVINLRPQNSFPVKFFLRTKKFLFADLEAHNSFVVFIKLLDRMNTKKIFMLDEYKGEFEDDVMCFYSGFYPPKRLVGKVALFSKQLHHLINDKTMSQLLSPYGPMSFMLAREIGAPCKMLSDVSFDEGMLSHERFSILLKSNFTYLIPGFKAVTFKAHNGRQLLSECVEIGPYTPGTIRVRFKRTGVVTYKCTCGRQTHEHTHVVSVQAKIQPSKPSKMKKTFGMEAFPRFFSAQGMRSYMMQNDYKPETIRQYFLELPYMSHIIRGRTGDRFLNLLGKGKTHPSDVHYVKEILVDRNITSSEFFLLEFGVLDFDFDLDSGKVSIDKFAKKHAKYVYQRNGVYYYSHLGVDECPRLKSQVGMWRHANGKHVLDVPIFTANDSSVNRVLLCSKPFDWKRDIYKGFSVAIEDSMKKVLRYKVNAMHRRFKEIERMSYEDPVRIGKVIPLKYVPF